MSYVKNYDVGQIQLDLPTSNYIHELPLLSFGDVQHTINLSLVFNYARKAAGEKSFHIANGFKLNMQKKLHIVDDYIQYEDESGKLINLTAYGDVYTFDDDSQRILRRTEIPVGPPIGGSITPGLAVTLYDYTVEYPDYSKEEYDYNGYITGVYDKYGTKFLSYTYSGTKLTAITYRGEKIISFTYDGNNRLESITYADKDIDIEYDTTPDITLTFTYTTSDIKITNYTGVTFTLTFSENAFTAYSTDGSASYSNDYSHKVICTNEVDKLTIERFIGSKTVDKTIFDFLNETTEGKFTAVNITDFNGVVTRVQYENDKPFYSYELMNIESNSPGDIFFEDDGGNRIYKGTVSINTEEFCGVQRVNDGIKFNKYSNNYDVWRYTFDDNTSLYGNFIVSGWICAEEETYTVTVRDTYKSIDYGGCILSNLTPGVWNYFCFKVYMNNPEDIFISINNSNGLPTCLDIRMMFEEGKIYSTSDINHFTVMKDVLVKEGSDASNEKIIPLDNTLRFYRGNSQITEKITIGDILRYKINQKQGRIKNEIYYNNCRGVITNAGVFAFEYDEDVNGVIQTTRLNVNDIAVGKARVNNEKTYLTKMNFYTDSSGNSYFASKMYINGTEIKNEKYDDKFDIISSTIDGVTTTYARTNGLVTSESVGNLYTRTTAYAKDSANNPTVTITDEFNNTTVYKLDSVWGVVTKVTLPDGTIVTDEYDDDMCAITKRTFGNSNSKSILYSYSKGNISGLQTGNLNFDFTYSKGDMTAVKKFGTNVEEHEYSDTSTTSYYPSKISKVYQNTVNYDKYGRVISVGDEITNVYNISPKFNSSGNIVSKPNNADSVLAMSTDHKANQVARYEYNDNKTLKKKTVTGSSFSNKVSEETFTYDTINRVKSHSCTYDVSNSKSVSGNITYVKAETDSSADNRIYTYAYNVNGVRKAYSYNNYDAFNRSKTKGTTVGNQGLYFTRAITYNKTRVSKVADTFSGANRGTDTYGYDALGRITSHSYSSASTSDSKTYVYDSCGQLVRENNKALDKTYMYEYNNIGNIIGV
ncbi:MAG: hypothetical protein ACI3XL_01820, partial [Eubacteriales bacterium]